MLEIHATHCCAMDEINNISHCTTPQATLKALKKAPRYWWKRPFMIYTGVTTRRAIDHASGRLDDYGQALTDFIRERGLGKVTASNEQTNHGMNGVTVWIWEPNYDAIDKWEE